MSAATSACTCMQSTGVCGQLSSWPRSCWCSRNLGTGKVRHTTSDAGQTGRQSQVEEVGRQALHRDRGLPTREGPAALCSASAFMHLRQRRSVGQVARADAGEARAEVRDALHLRHHAVQQHRARAVHDAHPAPTRARVQGLARDSRNPLHPYWLYRQQAAQRMRMDTCQDGFGWIDGECTRDKGAMSTLFSCDVSTHEALHKTALVCNLPQSA